MTWVGFWRTPFARVRCRCLRQCPCMSGPDERPAVRAVRPWCSQVTSVVIDGSSQKKPRTHVKGASKQPDRTEQQLRAEREAIDVKLALPSRFERAKCPPTSQASRTSHSFGVELGAGRRGAQECSKELQLWRSSRKSLRQLSSERATT